MPFDDDLKQAVLAHSDIVEVISSFLTLTKRGKDYLAICPFHDDTNPSMRVSPSKKMFKCFVCGTGGDVFSFVSKYLHISYGEAIRKVAEISGYSDPRLDKAYKAKPIDQRKAILTKCLKDLTLYYSYSLSTEEGKEGWRFAFGDEHPEYDFEDGKMYSFICGEDGEYLLFSITVDGTFNAPAKSQIIAQKRIRKSDINKSRFINH